MSKSKTAKSATSGWKQGPLPPDSWMWGGVTKVGEVNGYFYFADFKGDHVVICPSGEVLKPDQVAMYNNSLELPPNCMGRAG